MCEIFLLKHKKGLLFEKNELEGARNGNSDGAGYVVFDYDRKKKKWEVVDFDLFKAMREKYSFGFYEGFGSYGKKDTTANTIDDGQEDYNIAMCGERSIQDIDKEDYDSETYEQEKEYFKSVLSKKDFLEIYPEEKKTPIGFQVSQNDSDECIDKIYDRQKQLKAGQMMITHFRMSTSGHSHDNTQPILNGDYITIHNGIFAYKSEPAGFSDTRYFSEQLKNESKKIAKITRKEEQKIIEKLLKKAGGSYSIFIYSFKTGQVYYYKSDYASFSWAYNGLMGATKSTRFPIKCHDAQRKELILL